MEATGSNARTWAVACHLSALASWVIPFGNLLGPLVVWLAKRNEDPFVDEQGKESLNFQLSVTLYAVVLLVALVLVFIIGSAPVDGRIAVALLLGVPVILLLLVGGVAWHVLVIMAAVRASDGQSYRYPLTIRWIR